MGSGGVINQTFTHGFQSAVMLFPLLRFRSTKEIDTLPYTSINREDQIAMALFEVGLLMNNVAEDIPELEEESQAILTMQDNVGKEDTDDTWIKKKDLDKLVKKWKTFVATAKAMAATKNNKDLDTSVADLEKMTLNAKEELEGQLHWDAVVGTALTLNISMDFHNNVMKGGEFPRTSSPPLARSSGTSSR